MVQYGELCFGGMAVNQITAILKYNPRLYNCDGGDITQKLRSRFITLLMKKGGNRNDI